MEESHKPEEPLDVEGLESIVEEGALTKVSAQRAFRFYDRIRMKIADYLRQKSGMLGKAEGFLFLVPDVFILLWRLASDSRVNAKNKILLGTGIAYYLFPLDIMPEIFMGPIGFLDDLVFGVYILNKMLLDTDEEILREHWSGGEDVLGMIRRVLNSADTLVASDLLKQLKKLIR